MKKMAKVILGCVAVLCAIDRIIRFCSPIAVAHIWNDMVLDGNDEAANAISDKINTKYCKHDQKLFAFYTKSFAILGEAMRDR